jgi:molybdopterin-guanine dinucleotide biosynthesis protein A
VTLRGGVAAAIIAGGLAERLGGRPKGLLTVGGRRIVDRQLEALRAVFGHVFLVANDPAPWSGLGIPIVGDRVPGGTGPLAGLDAALGALGADETAVACVAGDMPFLATAPLTLLRDHAPGAAAVVARVNDLPEPLFARYARSCAPAIATAIAAGRLRTASVLDALDVTYLDEPLLRKADPTLRFLENVNTPADLARVQSL